MNEQNASATLWPTPNRWDWATVQDIGRVALGRQRSPVNHSGPNMRPYVRAANITWKGWDLSDVKEMNFDDHDFARFQLKEGDVLVNEGSGSAKEVGKPAIWRGEIEDCCFQNTLIRVQPIGCSSEYLHSYFQFCAQTERFVSSTQGVNIHHIGKEGLATFPIPVPPLPEQRRITTKIDSLTGKSRRARDHLDHIPRLVEKYKQAVLAAAFRGDLTEGATPLVTLGSICDVRSGFAFSSTDFRSEGPVPVVRIGDISEGAVTLSETSRYLGEEFLGSAKQFIVECGDILVALSGATTGKSGTFNLERPALLNQRVARLRIDNEDDRKLVAYFVQSIAAEVLGSSYGGAQPNISPQKLAAFRLIWPAREQRQKIGRRIASAMHWIDRLASETTSARKLIDRLDQAVLAKAFRGELVPQDPADEPASALLERIRAERGTAPTTKRGRRVGVGA
ncbi:MAG: hypothetical protein EOR04_26015 [Mesorhizobium sp.]|uniref:restriction endonuclease subunit S n=1 Tax=Mesorhizobium sp. TaxID=1871066 RepID=UPI000FE7D8E0|nr:restriction endonuclease subunit S [Mesorhizobium sp.]RWP38537.1 MAG: hypothetical protein EOR04_26015 [Mesorhizobium sp.]